MEPTHEIWSQWNKLQIFHLLQWGDFTLWHFLFLRYKECIGGLLWCNMIQNVWRSKVSLRRQTNENVHINFRKQIINFSLQWCGVLFLSNIQKKSLTEKLCGKCILWNIYSFLPACLGKRKQLVQKESDTVHLQCMTFLGAWRE